MSLSKFILLFVLACLPSIAWAQSVDEDEPPEYLPGLIAEYSSPGTTLTRVDPDIAFDWSERAPDLRLDPDGEFGVRWSGYLQVKENGSFELRLHACGRVEVSVAGQQVLAAEVEEPQWMECTPVDLRFGRHALEIKFRKTNAQPRLGLFWSGPGFALEPISPAAFFHDFDQTPDTSFEIGQTLSRGLRCAACHEFAGADVPLPAPALRHLQDNLRPSWLVERLSRSKADGRTTAMPHFGLPRNDAAAITAALFAASSPAEPPQDLEQVLEAANKRRNKKDAEIRTQPSAEQGEVVFVSIGCVACHQIDKLGGAPSSTEQLFAGGDLSQLAVKRTADFITRWLADPGQVNPQHRMPVFELSPLEQLDLVAFLSQQGSQASRNDTRASGDVNRGAGLIAQHRCAACHQLPTALQTAIPKTALDANSDWGGGCLKEPNARANWPGFGLTSEQVAALRLFIVSPKPAANRQPAENQPTGKQLLVENNCLSCHQRDLENGLKAGLADIAVAVPAVAARLAALAPPALTGIGDKLHAASLRRAITREEPPRRPWLDVRMPKFRLSDTELDSLVDSLIAHDRIPDLPTRKDVELPSDKATELAAGRLVTADGFGCQSCHQIGDSEPPNVALNAHGTDLTMLGKHIRSSWFERWVRNPARIVPRMEMPAIQTPAKGVLQDSLDLQLAALWKTLNTPDFRPPRPNPVRVVRSHNVPSLTEEAHLLTDVIETSGKKYIRPLVFGLPNRHNLLYDLETARLATWWIGDTAHQHTRGKTWFWEPGANLLLEQEHVLEEVRVLDVDGDEWIPSASGQLAAWFDAAQHVNHGLRWQGRLHLSKVDDPKSSRWIDIEQTLYASDKGPQAATVCITELFGLDAGEQVVLRTDAGWTGKPVRRRDGQWQARGQSSNGVLDLLSVATLEQIDKHQLRMKAIPAAENQRGEGQNVAASHFMRWTSTYRCSLTTDQFPVVDLPPLVGIAKKMDVVPGYDGVQLPLPGTEMPISFAWGPQGEFYVGSLKGTVLQLHDRDEDGLPETYETISDQIPTPYGLAVHSEGLDALAKFGLVRFSEPKDGGTLRDFRVVADGWGYTEDYHDWAVGLEQDADGNYYMALPCQQDDRSPEAAYLRGQALKLTPMASATEPRLYRIDPIAAGLRFPMGIALNEQGELFTSDNQGNYNPFNELNHLRYGKRYGFINKLENKDGFSPPFESPAINLPHPWTRSVNGICFLRTPADKSPDEPLFGPFEGHLVGCEMNGRFLVRMSLQKVGDTYQGAAYLFSRLPAEDGNMMEGPIVCEISPDGDLYVGNLLDSGWGGGQNTGSIVRFRPHGELPLGIAEVRGRADGFEIDFTGQVDTSKAADLRNYELRSYQRISTPAYGGDDQDVRNERIGSIRVSDDRRRVVVRLNELREGFVYELNVNAVGMDDQPLFPSQAHYTMRAIPSEETSNP